MDKIPFLSYLYLLSILLAFLSSLISFRLDFAFHWKLFACLLGLTFPVEAVATISAFVTGERNAWLYNSFILIEFLAYGYLFRSLLPDKKFRWLFNLYFLLFPVFWFITVFFIFGFTTFDSHILVLGSFFTILFSLLVYYKILVSGQVKSLTSNLEFWLATAMLIGYLAALPYYGLLNFLNDFYRKVAKDLYPVLRAINISMYLTLSYGFLCQIRNTKKS